MKDRTMTSATTLIPIAKQARYLAAVEAINELAAAKQKIEERIADTEAKLRDGAPDKESSQVAAALEFANTGVVRAADHSMPALREEHVVLRQQLEALEGAIKTKHAALSQVEQELSMQACRECEPEHRKLAGRYLDALLELDACAEAELELIGRLNASGYAASFREYVRWNLLGLRRDYGQSAIWNRVREIEHYAAK